MTTPKSSKFFVLFFLMPLMCDAAVWNHSEIAPSGHTLYYKADTTGAVVVPCTVPTDSAYISVMIGELIIPDSVTFNGRTIPVRAIGGQAFMGCQYLTSVYFPPTIKFIGDGAFKNCTSLGAIRVPSTVDSINSSAFSMVNAVFYHGTSAHSPWGAVCANPYFKDHFYYSDSAMTDLVCTDKSIDTFLLPPSVTYIHPYAFAACPQLHSVSLEELPEIGVALFFNCNNIKSVYYNLPNNRVGYLFMHCTNLENVTFGDSVERIPAGCFTECTSLRYVYVPLSVTIIDDQAFKRCTSLESVIIDNGVSNIWFGAFRDCTNLSSVYLGESVKYIQNWAFQNCKSLKHIVLPSSTDYLKKKCFAGCNSLDTIVSLATAPPVIFDSTVFEGVSHDVTIIVPCKRTNMYSNAWTHFSNFVETPYIVSAESNNSDWGTAEITSQPNCLDRSCTVQAIPAQGYRFDHWMDRSTENPFILQDTPPCRRIIIKAFFAPSNNINEPNHEDFRIFTEGNNIIVETATREHIIVADIIGRIILDSDISRRHVCPVPHNGVYLVKVGRHPARKVLVQ